LVGEFVADFIDEGGFFVTVAAPGGPEFEEYDFAFDGVVGEFFAVGSFGVEAWGGFFGVGGGKEGGGEQKQDREGSPHDGLR